VVAAGIVAGLAIAFLLGRVGQGGRPVAANPVVAVAPPAPAVTPPVVPTTTAPPTTEVKAAVEKAEPDDTAEARGKDEKEDKAEKEDTSAKSDGDEATGKVKPAVRVTAAAVAAENKKMLADGERLLRAERFSEAREIFAKLTKSKKERGPALVGLAEISFQEKKYADAAKAAELAAKGGGGVKARVLLGDAHFRLARYKEAAKAYEDALKMDPGNASAKSGLALANKRM